MIDIIYKYKLKKNESLFKQGDIFKNLPIVTTNILVESNIDKVGIENEAELLRSRVINDGEAIFIETFLKPTFGILASQDCEIRPKYNLVFYPLSYTKPIKNRNTNLREFTKRNIRDTTRICYLPEIRVKKDKTSGPFNIDFQNPFTIPFEIVKINYRNCWIARVIEPARQVIIGKLTHFFTRTPLDEIIFLTNEEITKLIQEKWNKKKFIKIYKSKSTFNEEFNHIIAEITDMKNILNFIGRKIDYLKVNFIDLYLISEIYRKLINLNFGSENHILIKICKKLIDEKTEKPITDFKIILDFFKKEDLVKEFFGSLNEDGYRKITDNLKQGSIINEDLIDKEIEETELLYLGRKAISSLESLIDDKFLIRKYDKLYHIIK